jgi:hypothetical protein
MDRLPPAQFPDTHWSLIGQALGDNTAAQEALIQLVERYQAPLRAYLCARYRLNLDTAQCVLHDFLIAKFLAKYLLSHARPERGRFRDLLRTAMDNFLRSWSPETEHHALIQPVIPDPKTFIDRFDQDWASEVLRNTIIEFRQGCLVDGRSELWEIFAGRILGPALFNTDKVQFSDYVNRFGLTKKKDVANLLETAKRRFSRVLKSVVAEQAMDPDEELDDLKKILSRSRSIAQDLEYLVVECGIAPGLSDSVSPGQNDSRPFELFDMCERELHADELQAILTELLEQPITIELTGSGPGFASRLKTLASAQNLLLKGFGDLLSHPRPPLELLEISKEFAKTQMAMPESSWPVPVSHVLYLATICVAKLRCGATITQLDDASQIAAIEWAIEQPWVSETLRCLFDGYRKTLPSE